MRNIRDLRRVDAFRVDPTPTPTPRPTATPTDGTIKVVHVVEDWDFSSFDRTPPHPLADYFAEMGARYRAYGFRRLGRLLETEAGSVVENLFTRRGTRRLLAARNLAHRLAREVRRSTDAPLLRLVPWGAGETRFPDYRGLAFALAGNLRQAARNVSRHRPLTTGIRPRPQPLVFSVHDSGARRRVSRSDGYGGSIAVTLDRSTGTVFSTSDYNYGYYGVTAYSNVASSVDFASWSGVIVVPVPTPTPDVSPSPTPE